MSVAKNDNPLNLDGENLAVFIDGPGLYSTFKNLGFDVDFKRLRDYIGTDANLVRAYYYSSVREASDGEDYVAVRPLLDWLAFNGYNVVEKPSQEFTDSDGRTRQKNGMNVEMAVDMLGLLEHPERLDHVILFSGDGDFQYLVEAAKRKGVRVTVVSTNKSGYSMISDRLRRAADAFVDLDDMRDIIGRPVRARI